MTINDLKNKIMKKASTDTHNVETPVAGVEVVDLPKHEQLEMKAKDFLAKVADKDPKMLSRLVALTSLGAGAGALVDKKKRKRGALLGALSGLGVDLGARYLDSVKELDRIADLDSMPKDWKNLSFIEKIKSPEIDMALKFKAPNFQKTLIPVLNKLLNK
jgi:hypothetical protein